MGTQNTPKILKSWVVNSLLYMSKDIRDSKLTIGDVAMYLKLTPNLVRMRVEDILKKSNQKKIVDFGTLDTTNSQDKKTFSATNIQNISDINDYWNSFK